MAVYRPTVGLSHPNSVPTASYLGRLSAIFLFIASPGALPPISGSLQIRLVSDDPELHRILRKSIEPSRAVSVIGHSAALLEEPAADADILLLDVERPPLAIDELKKLRSANESALIIILAQQIDADVRELGHELGAVGYLKKDESLPDIATLVVELASLSC